MKTLLLLLFSLSLHAAPVSFSWTQSDSPNVAGYYLYVFKPGTNFQFDALTNRNLTVGVPSGNWKACATAYSTNNSSDVILESDRSNEVMFFVPDPVGLTVNVDTPFSPPLLTLASNSQMRVAVYLQRSSNLVNWLEGPAIMQVDVRDGTNQFYRARMAAAPK